MTLTERKRLLKSMDGAKKDELILTYFKRMDKQEKELFDLYIQAVAEGKEPPDAKAKIIDVKKARTKAEKLIDRMLGWRRCRGATRTKMKNEMKSILKELPLMPEEAVEYDLACQTYLEIARQLCVVDERSYYWSGCLEEMNLTWTELYRTACSMYMARGIRVETFEKLCDAILPMANGDWIIQDELLDVLMGYIRNGDLRFDLIDDYDQKIRALHAEDSAQIQKNRKRIDLYEHFYIRLMEADGQKEAALAQVRAWEGSERHSEIRHLLETAAREKKREEEERFASLAREKEDESD